MSLTSDFDFIQLLLATSIVFEKFFWRESIWSSSKPSEDKFCKFRNWIHISSNGMIIVSCVITSEKRIMMSF